MCTGQRPSSSAHATTFVALDPYSSSNLANGQVMSWELAHDFFRASSELFDHLHEILTRIYVTSDKRPALPPATFVSTVVELEDELAQWEDRLPLALRIPAEEPRGLFCFASHFLSQRYVYGHVKTRADPTLNTRCTAFFRRGSCCIVQVLG
jgi:hypothetical protein